MPDISILKPACGMVVNGSERGTGYLVDERHVVTCEHVVRGNGTVSVRFGDTPLAVTSVKIDPDADCAVLELAEPVVGITPLPIAAAPSGLIWTAFGFPGIASEIGLPLAGTIQDPAGQDVLRRPAIVLYSDQAAAGQGPPMNGFSGSPVMVDGVVVGHIKRILSSKDRPGRPELGVLFATPGSEILRVLGRPESLIEKAKKIAPPPATTLDSDQFHAFISYSSRWRDWARELVEILEGNKLRVFIDQNQLRPGDQLANTLQRGLSRCRGAIVLMTEAWLRSSWCQEEANVVLKRSVEEKDFRLIPLLLEDIALPEMWASRFYLDFRNRPHPDGPQLEKLLYALLGGIAPPPGSDEERVRTDAQRALKQLLQRIDAESISSARVYDFWQQLHKTSMPDVQVTLHAANRLISLGASKLALELLGSAGNGVRARQLSALAHAKEGFIDEAIVELELLEAEGHTDSETGGLLAGRYRQKAEQNDATTWFLKARSTYDRYFELTSDPYCGVNAANMALEANDRARATLISSKLIELLTKATEKPPTHWDYATLADAYFIIGDVEKGKHLYEQAAQKAAAFDQDRAVMRKYARITLSRLGLDQSLVDDILQIPQPVAFFGHTIDDPDRPVPRFPSDLIPQVRAGIRHKLEELQVDCGVSSACTGADLLFLQELLRRGGQATIVLPGSPPEFERAYLFGNWVTRFREILENSKTKVKLAQPQTGEDVWDACRREIVHATRDLARSFYQPSLLLVVWDQSTRSYVKSAIDLWVEEGDPVETIILQGKAGAAAAVSH